MKTIRIHSLAATLATALLLGSHNAVALDGPTPVRSLGPTGLEIDLQKDQTLKVTGILTGSPAEGKFSKGQIIKRINGSPIPEGFWEHRAHLGDLITKAEASDGLLKFDTDQGEVAIKLPVLGGFSETWPVHCPKTEKIIAANASCLRQLAKDGKLAGHDMKAALGIVSLLSTGEEQDLDAVRAIYQERMKTFDPSKIGPHTWHNGHQGIAACEYYLRTGDKSVMPLINAICEAARRYQVHGGYYHWATAANPKYGVVNACGTNMLTTMLLAKHCGAKVDDETLMEALVFFYRFAGHGMNPYGDGRPEMGTGGNGKTEQIAVAMQVAAKAKNGKAYAMAGEKCAQLPLYTYRSMFNGHTGPIGTIWYGPVAAQMIDKKPALFRNRMNEVRWFYELSRLHDGSFVISSSRGYDNTEYGRSMLLGLTAPRKALQITGAPRSKFGVDFTLPELPWGRPADLAFFDLEGSPDYKPLDPAPHLELEKIAMAGKQELRQAAGHPEHAFREVVAAAIRNNGHYDLIEMLLASKNPFDRHTACLAINHFQPWKLRDSKGWRSALSIEPEHFNQTMFDCLIAMVRNPDEALWLVDQSLLALTLARPEQTMAHLDAILPWLEHDEWWFYESASLALSPAFSDPEAARKVLPAIARAHGKMEHMRARQTVEYLMVKNADLLPEQPRKFASTMFKQAYIDTPGQSWEEGTMDLSAIPSVSLAGTINAVLTLDPELAPTMAELSVNRLDDLLPRERGLHIDTLIATAQKLGQEKRKQVGEILTRHYRAAIFEENAEVLSPEYKGYVKSQVEPLNKILAIDELRGLPGGWTLLDGDSSDGQQWLFTSFEPAEQRDHEDMNRHRPVTLPDSLKNWHQPDYDAKAHGWKSFVAGVRGSAPLEYRAQPAWKSDRADRAGEVLFMRKTFELEDLDFAMLRLVTYTRQGYQIFINGQLVSEDKSRSKNWWPRITYAEKNNKIRSSLRKGANVLAATSYLQYFKGKEGDIEVYLEGLKKLPEPK